MFSEHRILLARKRFFREINPLEKPVIQRSVISITSYPLIWSHRGSIGSLLLDLPQNVDWHSRWHHSARSSFKSLRAAAQVPAVCANIWPIRLSIFTVFKIITSTYWPLLYSCWFGIVKQITFSVIWMWSSTSAQNKGWRYIKGPLQSSLLPSFTLQCVHKDQKDRHER